MCPCLEEEADVKCSRFLGSLRFGFTGTKRPKAPTCMWTYSIVSGFGGPPTGHTAHNTANGGAFRCPHPISVIVNEIKAPNSVTN